MGGRGWRVESGGLAAIRTKIIFAMEKKDEIEVQLLVMIERCVELETNMWTLLKILKS